MIKEKRKSNPNGANQYLFDPRQDLCWNYYIDKGSTTFSNAYASAIRAGYTIKTSRLITTETWFIEKLRRLGLFSKAEKVLEEDLDMETVVPVIGMFGPVIDRKTKKPLKEISPDLRRIRQSASTFIASRLGKNKGYSTRSELTGADGKDLPFPIYGASAE